MNQLLYANVGILHFQVATLPALSQEAGLIQKCVEDFYLILLDMSPRPTEPPLLIAPKLKPPSLPKLCQTTMERQQQPNICLPMLTPSSHFDPTYHCIIWEAAPGGPSGKMPTFIVQHLLESSMRYSHILYIGPLCPIWQGLTATNSVNFYQIINYACQETDLCLHLPPPPPITHGVMEILKDVWFATRNYTLLTTVPSAFLFVTSIYSEVKKIVQRCFFRSRVGFKVCLLR